MKQILKTLTAAMAVMAMSAPMLCAADAPVKREMRSAWVATVWRLDWPQNTISETGNTTQIERQKRDLCTMLDSMAANNMNAINFQVRSRADAFYKSSYEPWSSDLVDERGMDPGYDPLAFCVEQAHARGLECHAWINPYRYESVAHQWDVNGKPTSYRAEHPDWLMDVTGSNGTVATILNPGIPEVTQRICDIVREIITNYDVDGLLFDDYFYLSGTPMSMDKDLWQAYRDNGGKLNQGDWRRDNVNRMVAAVYKTIKDTKPWVRFGISPAGIACTSTSVANKYGITPCPTGSDWQYGSIFSDPIAWVSSQSLDYISPQIYWHIGSGTDYKKAAKWWSGVANKFHRHFFSSHSISEMTAQSDEDNFSEFANQVRLNREYTENDAPGSIFYSVKYLYRIAPKFAHSLHRAVFNTKALIPAMPWHAVSNPGNVSNIQRNGDRLSWTGRDNVRYTVYAVPADIPQQNFQREGEYLLGTSYTPDFTLPKTKLAGYNYAVCVLDRYGNEYSPVFLGASDKTLPAPVLTQPADGAEIEMPFNFEWNAVDDAASYIVEVAADAAMTKLLYTIPAQSASISTDEFVGMPIETKMYWRVRACGNSYNDGVSEVRAFTALNLELTAPANNAQDTPLSPQITWTFPERDVRLQISSDEDFDEKNIILDVETKGGSYTVPDCILSSLTTYYVRLIYQRNGRECISPVRSFTTTYKVPAVPALAYPIHGGVLHADESIRITRSAGAKRYRLEVCASTSFSPRACYVSTNIDPVTGNDGRVAGDIKLASKKLVDGQTYYARVYAAYNTPEDGEQHTDFCTHIQFTYSAENGGVDNIVVDPEDAGEGTLYNLQGQPVTDPAPGLYIRRNGTRAVKVRIR